MTRVNLTLLQAKALAVKCMLSNGFDDANAQAVATRMVEAERDHCPSHGLFRLPWCIEGVRLGRVDGHALPVVEQIAPAVIKVDGNAGFAPLGQVAGHKALVDCAKTNGIAALGFVNMFHLAAMWPEVEALAHEGLCAFAFTPSYPYVAPAGGTKPLYGTNPMGFAWPRANGEPLVFDQASSAMARGDIQIAARDGKSVPQTAGIGPDGKPTTDPNIVLEGAQLGFGGYKGASLALMIELIAGPLIGDFLSFESLEDDAGRGGPPKGGELILAIDPMKFGNGNGFTEQSERLFEQILEQENTRLPSQRRYEARKISEKNGIKIPETLYNEIIDLTK